MMTPDKISAARKICEEADDNPYVFHDAARVGRPKALTEIERLRKVLYAVIADLENGTIPRQHIVDAINDALGRETPT